MLNEVKYSTYVDTGTYKSEIDLGDFIKCESNIMTSHCIFDLPAVTNRPEIGYQCKTRQKSNNYITTSNTLVIYQCIYI